MIVYLFKSGSDAVGEVFDERGDGFCSGWADDVVSEEEVFREFVSLEALH
jgi:hypothetical protein